MAAGNSPGAGDGSRNSRLDALTDANRQYGRLIPDAAHRFKNAKPERTSRRLFRAVPARLRRSMARFPGFGPAVYYGTGLGCGTTFSLVILFFALRSRTADQAAGLSGMAQSLGYLLAAVGPTLFGFIHDQSGNWTVPLATITSLSLLTILFGYAAGRKGYIEVE